MPFPDDHHGGRGRLLRAVRLRRPLGRDHVVHCLRAARRGFRCAFAGPVRIEPFARSIRRLEPRWRIPGSRGGKGGLPAGRGIDRAPDPHCPGHAQWLRWRPDVRVGITRPGSRCFPRLGQKPGNASNMSGQQRHRTGLLGCPRHRRWGQAVTVTPQSPEAAGITHGRVMPPRRYSGRLQESPAAPRS